MRNALLKRLTFHMRHDGALHLLTADTGFHVFDRFQEEFAGRYLNTGISESCTIGMAAGLALCGKRVFVYGIVPFVTMRCFEQIRNDLCGQNLPVTIVGIGEGLTYGPAGASHHAIEDMAVMCSLPNMTVISPGDPAEAEWAVDAIMGLSGPCYLRLGKSGEPPVHRAGLPGARPFEIGRGIRLRAGKGVGVIGTGNMLATARDVCDLLAARNRQPELISMPTVKPIDREMLVETAARCRLLATIEEHSVIGGLGSMVAGTLTDEGLPVCLRRFGIPDTFAREAGSQEYFREKYGLTAETIADEILLYEQRLLQR